MPHDSSVVFAETICHAVLVGYFTEFQRLLAQLDGERAVRREVRRRVRGMGGVC